MAPKHLKWVDLRFPPCFLSLIRKTTSCSPANNAAHRSCREPCAMGSFIQVCRWSDMDSSNSTGLVWNSPHALREVLPVPVCTSGLLEAQTLLCFVLLLLSFTNPLPPAIAGYVSLPARGRRDPTMLWGRSQPGSTTSLMPRYSQGLPTADKPTKCHAAIARHPLFSVLLNAFVTGLVSPYVMLQGLALCRIRSAPATLQGEDHGT